MVALLVAAPLVLAAVSPTPGGSAGHWQAIATAPVAPRLPAVAVWTGSRMLVWGGMNDVREFGDGAAYDPGTNSWRRIAPSPLSARGEAMSVWTGRELVIWGGLHCEIYGPGECGVQPNGQLNDGAVYNPRTNAWRSIARATPLFLPGCTLDQPNQGVWTGRSVLVLGAVDCGGTTKSVGAAYDVAHDTWSPVSTPPAQVATGTPVWTGSRMLVWPALNANDQTDTQPLGASYDPATDRWAVFPGVPLELRGPFAAACAHGRRFV